MYSPAIAAGLRERAHDSVSVHDRPDISAAPDTVLFAAMQAEQRAIVTNNLRDFVPPAREALQTRSAFFGLVLTSDRSLPRSRAMIGTSVRLLDELMSEHPADDGFVGRVHWLTSA